MDKSNGLRADYLVLKAAVIKIQSHLPKRCFLKQRQDNKRSPYFLYNLAEVRPKYHPMRLL
jgi:hypothetical protein